MDYLLNSFSQCFTFLDAVLQVHLKYIEFSSKTLRQRN